jgi:hypothetical protein
MKFLLVQHDILGCGVDFILLGPSMVFSWSASTPPVAERGARHFFEKIMGCR